MKMPEPPTYKTPQQVIADRTSLLEEELRLLDEKGCCSASAARISRYINRIFQEWNAMAQELENVLLAAKANLATNEADSGPA